MPARALVVNLFILLTRNIRGPRASEAGLTESRQPEPSEQNPLLLYPGELCPSVQYCSLLRSHLLIHLIIMHSRNAPSPGYHVRANDKSLGRGAHKVKRVTGHQGQNCIIRIGQHLRVLGLDHFG